MSLLRKAARQKAKIRLALSGTSGGGKTISALLIAYGITKDWNKIAVIDTENKSADLYANHSLRSNDKNIVIGEFQKIDLEPPFTTEKYIDAIKECENAGIEVIIIDSMTHEWQGILELVDALKDASSSKNAFTNGWDKATPKHNNFLKAMLQSSTHIIATMRSKQDYVLEDVNGKKVPRKVGLNPIQRDGVEFEFTIHFDLSLSHYATTQKDRTGLFIDQVPFIPSIKTGEQIKDWCDSGLDIQEELKESLLKLNNCNTVDELTLLKETLPQYIVDHADFKTNGLARFNAINKPKTVKA